MINQENLTEFVTIKLIIMKKLKKLQINHEKLMKNEELLILRGGYQGGNTYCLCNCTLIPLAWWKCYSSVFEMEYDIDIKCGRDGGCSCSDYLC
jgi:hypothetical protein